jgi:hypothetical protein
MANNIYNTIRAALETHLTDTLVGTDIAYENVAFSPTTGTLFVKPTFIPTTTQPATRGLNPQLLYQGVFNTMVHAPEGSGPALSDSTCNTIADAFAATTDIFFDIENNAILTEALAFITQEDGGRMLANNVINVSIRYAERQQGRIDTPWYTVPVNIGWYVYNT